MEKEIPPGTMVDIDFPNHLKPLPTGWEYTEHIALLYSYSQLGFDRTS